MHFKLIWIKGCWKSANKSIKCAMLSVGAVVFLITSKLATVFTYKVF